ncbi:MAG: hypothetical protein ACLPPV_02020 [Candidatus Korobacteraceae bacterium]
MNVAEIFRRITAALDQAGIPYMLTGSFASAYYGVPRSSQDIDLIIEATPARLHTFIQLLPSGEYYADLELALEAQKRQSLFNVIDLLAGWKIDLIFRKSRPFSEEEFGRRQQVVLQGFAIFAASAEDVVVAKLEWAGTISPAHRGRCRNSRNALGFPGPRIFGKMDPGTGAGDAMERRAARGWDVSLTLDQILRYDRALQKKFDWALQRACRML